MHSGLDESIKINTIYKKSNRLFNIKRFNYENEKRKP